MTDLRELEKRLEEATGPSQTLDRQINDTLGLPPIGYPRFTSSLDAAVALVERVLPGWEWERKCETNRWKFVRLIGPEFHKYEFMGPHNKHCTAWTFGETPPLALCLALIRALIAKGDRHD